MHHCYAMGGSIKMHGIVKYCCITFVFVFTLLASGIPPNLSPFPYFNGTVNCGSNNNPATYELFTFNGSANAIELAFSIDQLNWCNPMVIPNISLRDPRVFKFSGTYYMFGTQVVGVSSWSCLSSSDGLNWTSATAISTTGGGLSPTFSWAPTNFIDTDNSVHAIISIATSSGNNFQMYEQHPTGVGNICTQTWTNPAALTVTGQSSIIDPWITCKDDTNQICTSLSTGKVYYLFYTVCCVGFVQEYGQYASASSLTGTYTNVATGNWAGWSTVFLDFIEGMNLVKLSDRWRMFFDYDTSVGTSNGQIYYSDSFDNWATWSSKLPIATAPFQAKHGQIIVYP